MHMNIAELPDLDRRAVRATLTVVARLRPGDLERPTPCADWTLADLLAHMTVQHHGFASAAEGHGADPEAWRVRPLGDDPVAEYTAAAERVLAAFGAEGVLDRPFALPEFGAAAPFPGRQAIGFHLVDYVVHGWDVARSLGVGVELDADVVDAALTVAELVPDDERRLQPGAAFRPAVRVADDAPALDRMVALLGRSPSWPD
ncbi:MAG TPA: TIGR03086 family metal-binding protein [Streptosporangiales bacterium]